MGCGRFPGRFHAAQTDWLTDLEIKCGASTFHTDPFEPQPDGVGTNLSVLEKGLNGRGYVEFPYTLPQDSTLFLLFGEHILYIFGCGSSIGWPVVAAWLWLNVLIRTILIFIPQRGIVFGIRFGFIRSCWNTCHTL